MKLYILRHEDRTMDLTFFSPLTKNGLENSVELIKHLEKEKINKIYSSPYIRTLQTINPYSKKYNINPKLDYSLTELYQEDNIPKKSYQITLPEYIAESFNFDKEYTSQLIPSNINFPEDDKNFKKRVKNFIKEVIKNNYKSNDNILLVTHQGVFDTILDILRKKSSIDTEIKSDKGKFVKIFEDTKWNIKKIN